MTTHTIAIAASGYGDNSAASAYDAQFLARTITGPLTALGFTCIYVGECEAKRSAPSAEPAYTPGPGECFLRSRLAEQAREASRKHGDQATPPPERSIMRPPVGDAVIEFAVRDDATASKVDALIRAGGYHSRRVHHEDGLGSFTPFSGQVSELLVARWSELTALDELAESRKQTAELLEVLGLLTGREEISTDPTPESVAAAREIASKWAHDLANLVGALTWSIEANGEPKPSVAKAIEELRLLVRGFRGEPSSLSTDGLFAGFVAALFDESMARKPACDVEVEP